MPGFEDLLNQVGQVIGAIGGNVLNAVNMAGAIQHGGLPTLLDQQKALVDDPAFRQQLGQPGFLSALRGGMAGLGIPQIGPDPNVVSAGYGNQGQLIGPTARTNLPPLSPYAQAEQAKNIRDAQLRNLTPEDAAAEAKKLNIGQPGGPTRMTFPTTYGAETFGGAPSGGGIGMDWPLEHRGGRVFAVDPATGRGHPIGPDETPAPEDPEFKKFLESFAPPGGPAAPPTAAPTTPTPPAAPGTPIVKSREGEQAWSDRHPLTTEGAAPDAAPAAPSAPAKLPPVQKRFPTAPASELLKQPEAGTAGFPSPAFDDTAQAAPTAPQAPPRAAPVGAPPGMAAQPPTPPMAPPGWSFSRNAKGQITSTFSADKYNKAMRDREKENQPAAAKGNVRDQLSRLDSALLGYTSLYGDPRDPNTGIVTDKDGKAWGKVRDLLPSGKGFLGGEVQSHTTTQYNLWKARRAGDPRAEAFITGAPQALDFARAAGGQARMNEVELKKLGDAFIPSGYESQEEYDNKVLMTHRFFEAIRDGLTANLKPQTWRTMIDNYKTAVGANAAPPPTPSTAPPRPMAPIDTR